MKVREKKRKNVVNILTCVLSALGAIGLLLFYGSLPSKDNIQIGNLPKEFNIDVGNNHIDFQMENECSAYAAAYVMRHLGRQVAGSELYTLNEQNQKMHKAPLKQRMAADKGSKVS